MSAEQGNVPAHILAGVEAIRAKGLCGALSNDYSRVCIRQAGHSDAHELGWAEQGNVQSWREAEVLIRESLLDGTVGGDLSEVRYNRAIMALTALTAQIEELERELQIVNEANAAWGAAAGEFSVRAQKAEQERDALKFEVHGQCIEREKAERALAEMRKALERIAEGSDYTWGNIARLALRPSEDTSDE